MKSIKIDLPAELDHIELIPLGDMHLGDIHCDYKLITKTLDYIRDNPHVYCILNGDLMNAAIRTGISDVYTENLSPMEELSQCVKLFEPIKEKILCVVPGNHEARHYKTNGIDITELMCTQLGIHERYSATSALFFIRLGEGKLTTKSHLRPIVYTVYQTHGTGGGRREGGKINRLADLAGIVDADIYIMSHTHLPAVFKEDFMRVSASNSSVRQVPHLFINTNAFLGDYGGYADTAGFKPANTSVPILYLSGTYKDAKVKL